jgi:hypothetical protein
MRRVVIAGDWAADTRKVESLESGGFCCQVPPNPA